MRAPVPSSSWLKLTSLLRVAVTMRTGTCTSPKLMAPVQIELGIGSDFTYGVSGSGRDRGSGAVALEPRQGPLPGRRLHESRRHRLLLPDRAGDAAPSRGPAADPGAGARRPRRRAVLREAVPAAPPEVGARPRPSVAGGGQQGCVIEELAGAGVARQPRRARAAHPPVDASRIRGTRPRWCSISIPGAPAGILDCGRVALELRDILEHFDLRRGGEDLGRQGAAPLGAAQHATSATHDETKRFALALGQLLESRDPKRVTVDMAKEKRPRRVFVDWSQNDSHKTTVCAYSLRIRERPTVSTPVAWDEVERRARRRRRRRRCHFEAADVLDRIDDGSATSTRRRSPCSQQLPAL